MYRIRSPYRPIASLTVLTFFAVPASYASEILFAAVSYNDTVYDVSFRVRLDANANDVRRVVTDYANLAQLSPTIIKSRVSSRDGRMTVKLLLRPCVWVVFCKNLRKVSVVYEDGSEIVYHADPSVSDFLEARERLLVEDDSTRPSSTLLTYRARLIPKFVVPPLIGPWLIKRQIMRDLRITSGRVEFLAAPVGHDPAAGLQ